MKQPEYSLPDHEQWALDGLARAILLLESALISRDLTNESDRLHVLADFYIESSIPIAAATEEVRRIEAQYQRDRPFLATPEQHAEWLGLAPLGSFDILTHGLGRDAKGRLLQLYAHKASGRDRTLVHDDCMLDGCDTDGILNRSCRESGICPAKTAGYLLTRELTGWSSDSITYSPIDTTPYIFDPLARYDEAMRSTQIAVTEGLVDRFYAAGLRDRYEDWWELQNFVELPH